MAERVHLSYDKAGLIVDVIQGWPADWITDDDGRRFEDPREAVQAILRVPTDYVPIGCPSPGPDGRCPGHVA